EERAAIVDRIAGLGREDEVLRALAIDHHLGEVKDRLLAAVGRDHLAVRIELDAEASLAPPSGRLAQLGQSFRKRVARERFDALDARAPDQRICPLAGVALAEVDQLDALCREPLLRLLEADERIRAGGGENRRELHD